MASSIALETSPRLKPRPGFPVAEALLGLALFGAACVSIFLTRVPGGIALFWPGSAIAGAVLIRLRRVRWIAAAVFTFTPLALASIVAAHRPWPVAFAFSAVNLLEIALMVLAFRFVWRRPYPNITIEHAAWMTALFGIWIPALAGCLGGWLLHLLFAMPWITGMQQYWLSSHSAWAASVRP